MQQIKLKSKKGQSLVEILIAVAIAAIIIGGASYAISFIIVSSTANEQRQVATLVAEDAVSKVRAIADSDWLEIYNLSPKGSTSTHHVFASGTKLYVIEGKEGVLSDEVNNGLFGHWKFDEATGTTAYDYSGTGIHGTLINTPTRATSTCELGYCLDFDRASDEYVDTPELSSYKTDAATISVWFRPEELNNNHVYSILASTAGEGSNPDSGFHHRGEVNINTNGTIRAEISSYSGGCSANSRSVTSANAVTINSWTHAAVVMEFSPIFKSTLYLDGESAGVSEYTTSCGNDLNVLWIGRRKGENNMEGLIDDFRIYNRALTADEVKLLYNSTVFTRYFSVENVSRDASDNIVSSGGNDDPSTQKVTATIEWLNQDLSQSFQVIDYLTRWQNRVFDQSDWSGGASADAIVTQPDNKFSTSSNVDVTGTPGSIKLILP